MMNMAMTSMDIMNTDIIKKVLIEMVMILTDLTNAVFIK